MPTHGNGIGAPNEVALGPTNNPDIVAKCVVNPATSKLATAGAAIA